MVLLNLGGLCFFGLLWGLTIPLSKLAISTGHHPFGLIFWQLLIASVILPIVLVIQGVRFPMSSRHLVFYLVLALIGTLVPNSVSYFAIEQLSAGIMALVIASVPLMSLSIAVLARLETFSLRRLSGVLMGVLALILIGLPDAGVPGAFAWIWILIALLAPLCYGIEGNFVAAKCPPDLSPIAALCGASIVGTVIIAPIAWLGGYWVDLSQSLGRPEWALIIASIGHMCAYCGYLWLVARAGAVFSSQISYVVTLTGVFGAIVLLGESHGWMIWVAVALMLAGVTLVKPVGD